MQLESGWLLERISKNCKGGEKQHPQELYLLLAGTCRALAQKKMAGPITMSPLPATGCAKDAFRRWKFCDTLAVSTSIVRLLSRKCHDSSSGCSDLHIKQCCQPALSSRIIARPLGLMSSIAVSKAGDRKAPSPSFKRPRCAMSHARPMPFSCMASSTLSKQPDLMGLCTRKPCRPREGRSLWIKALV